VALESGPSGSFPFPCCFALHVSGFIYVRLRVSTWFRPILVWFVLLLSSELSATVTVKSDFKLVIIVVTPLVVAGTCILRYFTNVLLLNLPTSWIVSQ
jgi:hypothetical protein